MASPPLSLESSIEAVRNRKTHKLFIVVDDTLDTRYKVINPSGEMIILPDLLFDEDPLTVPPEQVSVEFTREQLDAYQAFLEREAEQARLEALQPKPRPAPERIQVEPPRRRTPPTRKKETGPVKRGLGASWRTPRLTFYRHKIEPLGAKQTFRIIVEGTGTFEITKEEFLANFNDVLMSPSYRSDGLYTYKEIPEKARKYFLSA